MARVPGHVPRKAFANEVPSGPEPGPAQAAAAAGCVMPPTGPLLRLWQHAGPYQGSWTGPHIGSKAKYGQFRDFRNVNFFLHKYFFIDSM